MAYAPKLPEHPQGDPPAPAETYICDTCDGLGEILCCHQLPYKCPTAR